MSLLDEYEASVRDSGPSGGGPGPGCIGPFFAIVGIVFAILLIAALVNLVIQLVGQTTITIPEINVLDWIGKFFESIPNMFMALLRFIGKILYSFTQIFYYFI